MLAHSIQGKEDGREWNESSTAEVASVAELEQRVQRFEHCAEGEEGVHVAESID